MVCHLVHSLQLRFCCCVFILMPVEPFHTLKAALPSSGAKVAHSLKQICVKFVIRACCSAALVLIGQRRRQHQSLKHSSVLSYQSNSRCLRNLLSFLCYVISLNWQVLCMNLDAGAGQGTLHKHHFLCTSCLF